MLASASKKTLDWIIITIYLSLLVIGILMLYATQYQAFEISRFTDIHSIVGRQALWILISIVAFIVVFTIDWKVWQTFAYLLYVFSLVLLLALLFFGTEVKGATAWIKIGTFSVQPSELAKIGTCLALASYLSFTKTNVQTQKSYLTAVGLILAPAILVAMQPDFGTVLIYLSLFIVLYKEGLSPIYFVLGLSLMLVFVFSLMYSPKGVLSGMLIIGMVLFALQQEAKLVWLSVCALIFGISLYLSSLGYLNQVLIGLGVFLLMFLGILVQQRKAEFATLLGIVILSLASFSFGASYTFNNFLKPHQQERINVWLRPEKCDPQGSLYNLIQSKLAISAGGLQGKGFLKGNMTKLNYVPEQSTDFIFSTVGEEQGLIGSVSVIILFTILLLRIIAVAERSRQTFISNFAYGVAAIIFSHFFINIGMTMGIMPVVGIPLPFLSKGGSALLAFSIMIAMLVKMDLDRFTR